MRKFLLGIFIHVILSKNIVFVACCEINSKNFNITDNNNRRQNIQQNLDKWIINKKFSIDNNKFIDDYKKLIVDFCLENDTTFEEDNVRFEKIPNSKNDCRKFTIDDNGKIWTFFVKKWDPINCFYIEILKKIGLFTLKYKANSHYILTPQVDLSDTEKFKNLELNKTNKFDENILNKIDSITNLNEFFFFSSLLDLPNRNFFFNDLDNLYISGNKILFFSVNSGKNSLFKFAYSSITPTRDKFFYSPLLKKSSLYKVLDEVYCVNKDDNERYIAAIMFIINVAYSGHFFTKPIKIKEFLKDRDQSEESSPENFSFANYENKDTVYEKSEILSELEKYNLGKVLKMFDCPKIPYLFEKVWRFILDIKYPNQFSFKEVKEKLLEIYKDCKNDEQDCRNNEQECQNNKQKCKNDEQNCGYDKDTFISLLCCIIFETMGNDSDYVIISEKEYTEMTPSNFNSNFSSLFNYIKDNSEKCLKIIKTLEKCYTYLYSLPLKKIQNICNTEKWSSEEKTKLVIKVNVLLDYLKNGREVCDQNNSIFKNVDSLIIYRLNIFNRLNLYPFIFENEKISHSLKNLSNI